MRIFLNNYFYNQEMTLSHFIGDIPIELMQSKCN
jgi:hypothetical protein